MAPPEPPEPPEPPGPGVADAPAADADATADASRPAPPRGDELRAGDLVTRSRAQLEEELDPETVAQLARWFGLPSFEELAERETESADTIERRELREKIDAVADARLLARLHRHDADADGLLLVKGSVTIHADASIAAIDPTFSESLGRIAEPTEVEVPFELEEDLRQCTPQAILRDLHRPEESFLAEYEADEPPPPTPDVLREIREIMATSFHYDPVAQVGVRIRESLSRLRWLKSSDWGALPVGRRA